MSEPFIGEIRMFGGNFAPRNWAFCNGQLLPISQNAALFSLLGTIYGGDGRTTFALPDLRGRTPIHFGQGPGLSQYPQGDRGGIEQVALTLAEMPIHDHALMAADVPADQLSAANHALAVPEEGPIYAVAQPNLAMAPGTVANTGNSQPHENRAPYLTVNYIIALVGIFPSRS
ncbi:phage tail protein [Nodosilinea sp. LEGE 07088]|uniref:phage tail protein n=1 Tax=Nodosilinea sp. LEGE 07088 TaxID=2777968 RepID=UPI00187EA83B|nr:tail fiber protein [Nodosilinea sp. LEGE 07088]MBE9141564.1 phage tail protein [Nodosilinea sp. LEGE 07088]